MKEEYTSNGARNKSKTTKVISLGSRNNEFDLNHDNFDRFSPSNR